VGRGNRLERVLLEGEGATAQTTLRWTILLLVRGVPALILYRGALPVLVFPMAAVAVHRRSSANLPRFPPLPP
jgi:hypothetical protein